MLISTGAAAYKNDLAASGAAPSPRAPPASGGPKPLVSVLTGHIPGREERMRYLRGAAGEPPPVGNPLPTASRARVERPMDWRTLRTGRGHLRGGRRPRRAD